MSVEEHRDQLARIRQKLDAVRARAVQTFGSGTHRYALGPPLTEDAIRTFEIERGIILPAADRAFIGTIGIGGSAGKNTSVRRAARTSSSTSSRRRRTPSCGARPFETSMDCRRCPGACGRCWKNAWFRPTRR